MTYKKSLEIAFRYADSEESDFDYPDMFYTLADEAQKLIATKGDYITKSVCAEITDDKTFTLPDDFYEFESVLSEDGTNAAYRIADNNHIVFENAGKYTILYHSLPDTVDDDTPDDYVYQVPEYTHPAIPYYIAYRLIETDDITLSTALKNQWNLYMSIFNKTRRAKRKKIINVYGRGGTCL